VTPTQALAIDQPEETSPWKAKILMVDDNEQNLLALEAVLEHADHELVKATSGREALRYLLADDFAVILLDVKMPDMDGFETASLIRARKRSEHTPIVFLTAFKGEEQLSRGYDLGAVDFLFKPIVPEILRTCIRAEAMAEVVLPCARALLREADAVPSTVAAA